jgi:hypothetical protein
MKPADIEDLYLQSLDRSLTEVEKASLQSALETNPELAKDVERYNKIRSMLLRSQPATFGPYFSQRVIARIQGMRVEIDKQIMFFFKKYQLAAVGVLIALLSINIIFADKIDLPSVLGIEDATATADEDVVLFDLYSYLNN